MRTLLPFVLAPVALGQCDDLGDGFAGADTVAQDRFGWWVQVHEDMALISARRKNAKRGMVYEFQRSGADWTQVDQFVPDGIEAGAMFGDAIALDGDVALVTATHADTVPVGAGRLYAYERGDDGWALVQEVFPSGSEASDFFGFTVAMEDGVAVAGASYSDLNNSPPGRAYVFERRQGTWVETDVLAPDDPHVGDVFGEKVMIGGGVIAVCAPGADGDRGAVYIFERIDGEYVQTQKLQPASVLAGHRFGQGAAMAPGKLLVGAPAATVAGLGAAGRVYAYDLVDGAWSVSSVLTAIDGPVGATFFGNRIAMGPNHAIVGATEEASAHLFLRSGGAWLGHQKLETDTPGGFLFFGFGAGLDDGHALIGEWGANNFGGLVHPLDMTGCNPCGPDCNGDEVLNVLDFVCFQGLFKAGDMRADCDANGELNVLDFACFSAFFQIGCP